ncbi:recombinase family protein [Rhodococcus globerulus]|uniref:recombinase family protein n=1 Tax=Rhodococcus globerulus TaxID=33008 RepID=UPI0039E73044
MRAVIYTRVSSDPTGRGRSVTEQEAECRAICDREGWDVAEVLTDNDIGASRHSGKDRPAYRKLADTLQRGDVLVTWEASRAQRDLAAYVELRNLCAERDVRWSYSGKLYDLGRGDDRFTTGLDALLAEKEAEQIRERVLRAQRANAEKGLAHGRIPYGYLAVRDNATGKIVERVPHPEQAPIVKEIVARFLAGESLWAITKNLNERGIATPGTSEQWRASILTQMLKRPTYAGLRTHKGVITGTGNWEALISDDNYRSVLAILGDPSRLVHRGSAPVHLLTGIARCGECNSTVSRLKSHGYPALVCANRCVSRSMARVEKLVLEGVLDHLEDREYLDSLNVSDESESVEALAEVEVLRKRLESFFDEASEGLLSASALSRIEAKLQPQIDAAMKRIRPTVRHPLLGSIDSSTIRADWPGLPIEQRRELVRALCVITILPTRKGKRFDPNDITMTWAGELSG